MKNSSTYKEKNYGGVSGLIKGIIVSFIITFSSIILFAFLIKWFNFSDNIISPVNLAIKGISIVVGAYIFTRKGNKGIIKGGLFGLLYISIAFILFSLLAGTFNLNIGFVLDLLFGLIVGAVIGIIGANTKK